MKLAGNKVNTEHVTVNAEQYCYGRLCSYVAYLLRSKHRQDFNLFNSNLSNTVVLIKNINLVKFSKKDKFTGKKFYRHTGYMGGLKYKTLGEYISSGRIHECFVLSVRRMLKNTNNNQTIVEKNIKFVND